MIDKANTRIAKMKGDIKKATTPERNDFANYKKQILLKDSIRTKLVSLQISAAHPCLLLLFYG